MDVQRALLAFLLSLAVLVGYQYFFVPPPPPVEQPVETAPASAPAAEIVSAPARALTSEESGPDEDLTALGGRDLRVDTSLYSAVFTENGGGLKSFKLKAHKETMAESSDAKELVKTTLPRELPLFFSWGIEPGKVRVPVYSADRESLALGEGAGQGSLSLKARLPSGLEITKSLTFDNDKYQIRLAIDVANPMSEPIQGSPFLTLTHLPFTGTGGGYIFTGPAMYLDGRLQEVKTKELKDGPKDFTGRLTWAAYEGNYFMAGVLPDQQESQQVRLSLAGEEQVTIQLSNGPDTIEPGGRQRYEYTLYFGPKKLTTLAAIGSDLDKIVNFGWFDIVAKPTLSLLNLLYRFTHNYGLAIILVTVLIKIAFWPISQKGMKSMKNMQKIQPKMAKLREKYKGDNERLNREMMNLYKTYKVNPVGGCLPMIIQIPVFFALYKVLLQSIELRHAPFFLWIQDLSAPDRLPIGIDIPYLGGIPVLTLLMGASMFLQQKMSPASPDPTQAKIMMFLPVIFTFMFINFASGLVLYWFVNNLLAIGQQYLINRQTA